MTAFPTSVLIDMRDYEITDDAVVLSVSMSAPTCESHWGNDIVAIRCQRERGHRPQTWHRATYPEKIGGGTVEWSFTDDERAEWKRLYGKAAS